MTKADEGLRSRSGFVDSTDPLVSFLYILMRDHVPAGVVEEITRNHCEKDLSDANFCNGFIANYAKDVARRLQNAQSN